MILETEQIEWRSMDENPDDSNKMSKGQGILLYVFSHSLKKKYVVIWTSRKGIIPPLVGYDFLAWAYFPKGPESSTI